MLRWACIALFPVVVVTLALCAGCAKSEQTTTHVHISLPTGYSSPQYSAGKDGSPISDYFGDGIHTIMLRKGEKSYMCAINVFGGGEAYVSLRETDLCPVVDAMEMRGQGETKSK